MYIRDIAWVGGECGGGIDLGGPTCADGRTGCWVRVARGATLIGIGAQKSLVTTRLQLTWQLIQAPGSPVGDTSSLPLRYKF